eukprot:scaffold224943_cov30-Tisochrysis_lutea.AAC.4
MTNTVPRGIATLNARARLLLPLPAGPTGSTSDGGRRTRSRAAPANLVPGKWSKRRTATTRKPPGPSKATKSVTRGRVAHATVSDAAAPSPRRLAVTTHIVGSDTCWGWQSPTAARVRQADGHARAASILVRVAVGASAMRENNNPGGARYSLPVGGAAARCKHVDVASEHKHAAGNSARRVRPVPAPFHRASRLTDPRVDGAEELRTSGKVHLRECLCVGLVGRAIRPLHCHRARAPKHAARLSLERAGTAARELGNHAAHGGHLGRHVRHERLELARPSLAAVLEGGVQLSKRGCLGVGHHLVLLLLRGRADSRVECLHNLGLCSVNGESRPGEDRRWRFELRRAKDELELDLPRAHSTYGELAIKTAWQRRVFKHPTRDSACDTRNERTRKRQTIVDGCGIGQSGRRRAANATTALCGRRRLGKSTPPVAAVPVLRRRLGDALRVSAPPSPLPGRHIPVSIRLEEHICS